MNYDVRWQPLAETQLLALFIRSADKDVITAAVARVDEILARDPTEQGEAREGARRIWFSRPLCVDFVVESPLRVVFVTGVKWAGR